jgi:hypothetical protein
MSEKVFRIIVLRRDPAQWAAAQGRQVNIGIRLLHIYRGHDGERMQVNHLRELGKSIRKGLTQTMVNLDDRDASRQSGLGVKCQSSFCR